MEDSLDFAAIDAPASAGPAAPREATRLRDLSAQQWKSGIAAWLGWLFDGLDMHLYTVVATPFVALLLTTDAAYPVAEEAPAVGYYSSWIQAAFLFGWAVGGGFFGRIGDRLGRARALMLTILTYAAFTGLSSLAQTWWHLLICRFLAALGIGGEWAVGASLLSETWPKKWRPWIAATLQSAVNCGVLLAMAAVFLLSFLHNNRYVFLVGVLPALMVLWIRRAVPEPEEWCTARLRAQHAVPRIGDLFRGSVRRITALTILVCSLSLTAHWAFMFWFLQHLHYLLKQAGREKGERLRTATYALALVMVASIVGNFLAGWVAKRLGYRRAIGLLCVAYFLSMYAAYSRQPEPGENLLWWYAGWYVPIGMCQGLFGLFTMYLPPLFPTLLRTTGAGFCYNIGRIAAAAGTVVFGLFSVVGDPRLALLYSCFLFLPAAAAALLLMEPPDETAAA